MLIIQISVLIILTLIIAIVSFSQRGPLISVMYYMSGEQERKELKTKKRYYFIGTIYLLSSILLIFVLLDLRFGLTQLEIPLIIIAVILCIYFIIRYKQLESERIKNRKIKR